jgi:hypothetical protein
MHDKGITGQVKGKSTNTRLYAEAIKQTFVCLIHPKKHGNDNAMQEQKLEMLQVHHRACLPPGSI